MKRRPPVILLAAALPFAAMACSSGGTGGGTPTSPRGSATESAQHPGFATYSNSDHGFTIQYPKDWEKQEGALGAAVLLLSPREGASDQFRENVNVLVQQIPDKMSLDDYTKLSVDQAPRLITGFHLLEQGSTELAGRPAHRIHYRGEQGVYRLEWEQAWLVTDGQAFVVTYTAERDRYETYRPTAEAMFASFRLR